MAEDGSRRRVRQPPSVPFLWEVRPGTPKKDWKPEPSPPIDPPLLLLPPPLLDGYGDGTFDEGQAATFRTDDDPFGFNANEPCSITRIPSRPVKFVASVPFVWEEKPGKPLPYFSPQRTDITDFLLPLPPPPSWNGYEEVSSTGSNDFSDGDADDKLEGAYKSDLQSFTFETCEPPVPRVPSRPVKFVVSVPFRWEEKPGKPLSSFPPANYPKLDPYYNDVGDTDDGSQEGIFEWEIESFRFDTDEEGSFGSAQSLLANCLVPSSAISTAVPVEESAYSTMENSPELASSSSSSSSSSNLLSALETESSASSYAAMASGPVGPAFLEWLFPLFPPKSGILERSGSPKRAAASTATREVEGRDFGRESNGSLVWRRPTTLGELIMMSRRRSYRRKAVQMRKKNSSIHEFMKRSAFGCGIFGQRLMEGLNLKRQLRLKLV